MVANKIGCEKCRANGASLAFFYDYKTIRSKHHKGRNAELCPKCRSEWSKLVKPTLTEVKTELAPLLQQQTELNRKINEIEKRYETTVTELWSKFIG